MESRQLLMRLNCDQTLVNLCLGLISNMVKNGLIKVESLSNLPKNLIASLLNTFSKRGYLTDSNIELFLNGNTRELDLSECDQLTDKGLVKISLCKYIRKIVLDSQSMPRTSITAEGLDMLVRQCKYLQSISLTRCSLINDQSIETVAKCCPRLKTLSVAYCSLITDKTLIALGNYCKQIESIRLNGTKITDDGIFLMFSKPNIAATVQEIHVAHCNLITDQSIECILMYCKRVKYLLFHSCPKVTPAARIALEDYMTSSSQKVKHITWTIY